MNYIGSKQKISDWLKAEILKRVDIKNKTFCDIFAGTGAVSKMFKGVANIIANDIEYYAYVLNRNYIWNNNNLKEKIKVIERLNKLPLREDGFIYNNYCSPANRLYFSDENGKKIDAVRMEIEKYKNDRDLYFFLLASLIESADKVANTASVYGAFLKKIKKSAEKPLIIRPAIYKETDKKHLVFQEDSNKLIEHISGDVLYIDPPYNARQYGANYHLLNTIAMYDEFDPKGKTGLRDYYKSPWCQKSKVKETFENLIKNADFEWIFLSYNNEGLMSINDIETIMSKYGSYDAVKREHQRYKADSNRDYKANKTYEYLHVCRKQKEIK